MNVDSISLSAAVDRALAAKQAAGATKVGLAMLRKSLDAAESSAANLISMIDDVGKILNVVG